MQTYQLRRLDIPGDVIADVCLGASGAAVVIRGGVLTLYPSLIEAARICGAAIEPVDMPAARRAELAKRLRVARREIEDVLTGDGVGALSSFV